MPLPPPPAPFAPEVFGDFLLVQRLARSAMAEVMVAVRLGERTGRTVVVKRPVLGERASGRAAQAIAREAEVLSTVRGPGLCALEGAGEIAGLPYVAVEHVRGVTLDALLERGSPLPRGAILALAHDLGRALATLHAAGWVHGDVTPSNVMVDDAGEARLLDLGVAWRVGERRAEVAGKPGYVAPEAVLPGVASVAEDVYGFAVVMAECALGRRLFAERDLVEAATRGDGPEILAGRTEVLPGIAAALARRPEERPTIEALLRSIYLGRDSAFAGPSIYLGRDSASAGPSIEGARVDGSIDRGTLAELVADVGDRSLASRGRAVDAVVKAAPAPEPEPPRPALTPTAPMVVPAPPPVAAPRAAVDDRAEAASQALARPGRWLAIAIAGVMIFGAGVLAGRASRRSWQASLTISGSLQRRAQIELDDRPIAYPMSAPMPLPPGLHTIAIVAGKARREYTFEARPNDHVVFALPQPRRGGLSEGSRPSLMDEVAR